MTRYAIQPAHVGANHAIIATADQVQWDIIANAKNRDTAALIALALNEHDDLLALRNDLEAQT